MQSDSSRELPNIRQNVNSQVSFHELYFFHSIAALYTEQKKETQQLYFTKFLANFDTIRNHCISTSTLDIRPPNARNRFSF